MRKALKILAVIVLIAGAFYYGYAWQGNLAVKAYSQGWKDGWAYLKPIDELQRQVGAVPDGVWGIDTNRLYDRALCDQFAEWATCSNVRKWDKKMLAKAKGQK